MPTTPEEAGRESVRPLSARENGNGGGTSGGGGGSNLPGGTPNCPTGTHPEAIQGVWICVPDAPAPVPPPGGGGTPPLTCAPDEHVEPLYGEVDGVRQQIGWQC